MYIIYTNYNTFILQKDQVSMSQVELDKATLKYEQLRQSTSKKIKDLQEHASHWKSEVRTILLLNLNVRFIN